ncbi:DUF305 domain-containing protein, partial [Candidatus Roizmanbacteria bacterium]|nr:DUF305 domain-containing protein [Candidatus Roizmanbacteria bacterium]
MTLVASNAVNTNNYGMMQRMGMNPSGLMDRSQQMGMDRMHDMMMGEGMSMSGMVEELQGKEGDAFDDAFTDLMIEHHQGAI